MVARRAVILLILLSIAVAAWVLFDVKPPAMQSYNLAVSGTARRAMAMGVEYLSMLVSAMMVRL